jgi:ComF family protein
LIRKNLKKDAIKLSVFISFLKKVKNSFLHLVYPLHCLHCEELLAPDQPLFCQSCAFLLEMINPEERCPSCFNLIQEEALVCLQCRKNPPLFSQMGAVFDYVGPAASLIKKLKYSNQPHLAKGAGAFLVAQFEHLKWPLPDAIIPVPLSFTHWIDRGYNQSALLAEQVANLLQVPVWQALQRRSGDYSQAGLTLAQRQTLEGKHFKLQNTYELADKTLLLIDDVMTTGSTLKRCAEVLIEACPLQLYALTFCRAVN